MDKSLKDKAIKIQNKDYVLVADRVIFFNECYPQGCIQTQIISPLESERIVVKAVIYPDIENKERFFIGHSQETIGQGYINKTSALENCETSAVGRALAFMGIGVIDSVASVDEINKAAQTPFKAPTMPVGARNWQKGIKPLPPTQKAILNQKAKKPKIETLKEKLFKAGAKDEAAALKMILDKSGIVINKITDLTEEKAILILNSIVEA
ncbi:MAG: hypothetical protein AAB432_03225 [Patescibacteria group bacterium]